MVAQAHIEAMVSRVNKYTFQGATTPFDQRLRLYVGSGGHARSELLMTPDLDMASKCNGPVRVVLRVPRSAQYCTSR